MHPARKRTAPPGSGAERKAERAKGSTTRPRAASLSLDCPACGWPGALLDQRDVDGRLACLNCFREGSLADFLAASRVAELRAWADLPGFAREVLSNPSATLALRRVAIPLLEAGVPFEIVGLLCHAVNDRLAVPALAVEVERVTREAARAVLVRVSRSAAA